MSFSESDLEIDPFSQYNKWFLERPLTKVSEPYAASLGTADKSGIVSVRIVLVKEHDHRGFLFYTNYNSKKGKTLIENPACALAFYWSESKRQIRIEGFSEKIREEESIAYFKLRPRESQISTWASVQSSVIPNRKELEKQYDFYNKQFKDIPVDKPPHWGGFRVVPVRFEFWQEGDFRLHDRLTYIKRDNLWVIERLAP